MAFPRSANSGTHLTLGFDSNAFLNPLPLQGGECSPGVPFLQHSLLTFFSEFDTIITQELRRPSVVQRY